MDPLTPTCPRCGYDLSAATLKWEEACPLEGSCWECGLGLRWADVLRADRRADERHVEHAKGAWATWVAAWRSLLWALCPPVFWARVRLECWVVPRRLAVWVAVVFGTLWAVNGVVSWVELGARFGWTWSTFLDIDAAQAWVAPAGAFVRRWQSLGPIRMTFAPFWRDTAWGPGYAPLLACSLVFPLLMLVLAATRARAKVRPVHVLRAAIFGLAWLGPYLLLVMALRVFMAAVVAGPRAGWMYISLGGRMYDVLSMAYYASVLLGLGWIAWWWWCVLARGWRIEHPGRAWLSALTAGLLTAAIILALDRHLLYLLVT